MPTAQQQARHVRGNQPHEANAAYAGDAGRRQHHRSENPQQRQPGCAHAKARSGLIAEQRHVRGPGGKQQQRKRGGGPERGQAHQRPVCRMQASRQPQHRRLHVTHVGGGHKDAHRRGKRPRHADADQDEPRARDIARQDDHQQRGEQPTGHADQRTPGQAQRRELKNQQQYRRATALLHADKPRVSQTVAGDGLHRRPRHAEHRAAQHRHQQARQADIHHDVTRLRRQTFRRKQRAPDGRGWNGQRTVRQAKAQQA